jgi:hypothetical protein
MGGEAERSSRFLPAPPTAPLREKGLGFLGRTKQRARCGCLVWDGAAEGDMDALRSPFWVPRTLPAAGLVQPAEGRWWVGDLTEW